jgi:hypothetical protein
MSSVALVPLCLQRHRSATCMQKDQLCRDSHQMDPCTHLAVDNAQIYGMDTQIGITTCIPSAR